jgi:hypothetical protein
VIDQRARRGGPSARLRRFLVVGVLLAAAPASRGDEQAAGAHVDPGARFLDGDGAGEAWDVSARLDDGSHFFVRFWVTNEGPGSHTGVAMGYFVRPDGKAAQFRYGRTRDRWQSGDRGRFLKIASAVLDLRPPSGAVEIDTNKGGMKIYLRFAVPDSLSPLCARRAGDSGFDVLRLQEYVEGIAWVEGMTAPLAAKGAVDVTHAWGADSEIDTVLRRIDASGKEGDLTFFATTVVAPDARERPSSCVAVLDGGKPIFESHDAAVDLAATPLAGTGAGYPVPSRISFAGPRMALTVEPRRELLRVNPLDIVPQPFRALLALRSAPQRAWAETGWQLRLDGGRKSVERRGLGLAAISYTNRP